MVTVYLITLATLKMLLVCMVVYSFKKPPKQLQDFLTKMTEIIEMLASGVKTCRVVYGAFLSKIIKKKTR